LVLGAPYLLLLGGHLGAIQEEAMTDNTNERHEPKMVSDERFEELLNQKKDFKDTQAAFSVIKRTFFTDSTNERRAKVIALHTGGFEPENPDFVVAKAIGESDAEAGMVLVKAAHLIKMRDAHHEGDQKEVYYWLYAIACRDDFGTPSAEVWPVLERIARADKELG